MAGGLGSVVIAALPSSALTRVRPLSACEKWREFPIGGGDFLCGDGNRRSSADARVPARQHRPGIETRTV
jgi:hypothetical protein